MIINGRLAGQPFCITSKEKTMPHNVRHVALIVGSLRAESLNRKIAQYVCEIAPARWQISEIEIGDLPLYDQGRD